MDCLEALHKLKQDLKDNDLEVQDVWLKYPNLVIKINGCSFDFEWRGEWCLFGIISKHEAIIERLKDYWKKE